jgi:hypothetical protein
VTSANLLLVILIGTVVGAVVGLGLGGIISNPLWLGIVSGFLATITAAVVRDLLVRRGLLGPKGATLPGMIILYAAIDIFKRGTRADTREERLSCEYGRGLLLA